MKLYLICGKAGSGKDTLGKYLKKYYEEKNKRTCILKITDPLNELLRNYFNWNGKRKTKPRALMQEIGYDKIQNKLGKKTFLIDNLITKIEILNDYFDIGIITDGRLVKEIELLKEKFPSIKIILIKRENFDNGLKSEEKKHITEIDLDNYKKFDKIIINKSLNTLNDIAKEIIMEEENE